jgi:hypothetical protein
MKKIGNRVLIAGVAAGFLFLTVGIFLQEERGRPPQAIQKPIANPCRRGQERRRQAKHGRVRIHLEKQSKIEKDCKYWNANGWLHNGRRVRQTGKGASCAKSEHAHKGNFFIKKRIYMKTLDVKSMLRCSLTPRCSVVTVGAAYDGFRPLK